MRHPFVLLSALVAMAVATALSASSTKAAAATAALGPLTLSYDADRWMIVEGDGTLAITCVAEDCGGAVIDGSAVASTGYCDERAVYDAAAKAFPWATRHAVNRYTIGPFAVYFGWSATGLSLDDGRAVFACISREGMRYEFVSRANAAPVPGLDGLTFQLLKGLSAPPAALRVLDLGGAALAYAADTWQVDRADPDGGRWQLSCLPPYCDGIAPIEIRAEPVGDDRRACGEGLPIDPDRQPEAGGRFNDAEIAASLAWNALPGTKPVVRYGVIESRCRAMSPPHHVACAIVEGRRYTAWTGLSAGCNRGRPHVQEQTFLHLVRSLTTLQ